VIEDLRDRADPASGLHCLRTTGRLIPGAQVRIASGPFDGLEGIFEREIGTDRAIVLLRVLGQTASVRVPVLNIMPAHAA
jgi:hypothetical protein